MGKTYFAVLALLSAFSAFGQGVTPPRAISPTGRSNVAITAPGVFLSPGCYPALLAGLLKNTRNAVAYRTAADGALIACAAYETRYGASGLPQLELQSSNRVLQSDNLAVTWTKRGNAAVTTDGTVCPDSTKLAQKVHVESGAHDFFQVTGGLGATAAITTSIYLKPISATGLLKLQNANDSAAGDWRIDMALIGPGFTRITSGSQTGVATVTAWQSSAGGVAGVQLSAVSAALDFYLCHVQQEAGAAATSFMSTTTAVVTRPADALAFTQ